MAASEGEQPAAAAPGLPQEPLPPGYHARSGLPVPGGLSERLWAEAHVEVVEALHHPFVMCLATGTLDRASFQHYILQDAFFLSHFARSYSAALDKVSEAAAAAGAVDAAHAAAARAVLSALLAGVDEELRLHGAYAEKWGVAVHGGCRPSAATSAYTDFLLDVALNPETTVAEVLAAMIPCSRLYGFLGCTLAGATAGRPPHSYTEWLTLYSSPDYLALPIVKEQLFDKIAGGVDYERLKALYLRAMQLEVNFFSAQPAAPAPRNIGLLVADFDETLTAKDSIGAILAAAVDANVRASAAAAGSPEAEELRQRLSAGVRRLSEDYVAKQQQLLSRVLAPPGAPGAAAGGQGQCRDRPYDARGLQAFCEALSDFDVEMNQVVVDAGCLKGLAPGDLRAAGASVQLAPGAAQVLSAAAAARLPVAVLSVNWSTAMMQAALGSEAAAAAAASAGPPGEPQQQQQQQPLLEVHANELAWGADGTSSGDLQRRVQCARDKGRCMDELVARHRAGGAAGRAVVYVGDSASDIPPLLKADYGIVLGSNALLRRALSAFGVPLEPLCAAPLEPPPAGSAPVLYEAASWHEVAAFVFGPAAWPAPGGGEGAGAGAVAAAAAAAACPVVHIPVGGGAAAADADAAAAAAAPPAPVLTIAGSDSGGGAGIQADLKAIMANGGFGMSCLTALTAQNSTGVQGVHAVPPAFLRQQLDSVLSDLPPAAVKTGMLPDADTVRAVAAALRGHAGAGGGAAAAPPPLVVDPVMLSTSGHALADGGVGEELRRELFPLAAVVTPNLAEAEALWGAGRRISSLDDMKEAAVALRAFGCGAVLVKGGHLAQQELERRQGGQQRQQRGEPGGEVQAADVLYDGRRFYLFTAPFVETPNTHGTGCTLAAAVATGLARGLALPDAVRAAKEYLTCALRGSVRLSLGAGPQHPFHHGAGYGRRAGAGAGAAAAALGPPNPVDLRAYVVTDAGCNARAGRSLQQAVAAAVAGGATVVQLREKEMDGGQFVEEARAVIRLCRPLGVPVVINDRVDVAMASGADGVHVGQSDIPARLVRQMLGPGRLLGVSVKTAAEAAKARADGADYVGVGAVFPTGTKDSAVVGLGGLAEVCAASQLPAVAIGGVTAASAAAVVGAGAAGLAVVSAVFAAPDVEAATRELRRAVDAALAAPAGAGRPGTPEAEAVPAAAAVA